MTASLGIALASASYRQVKTLKALHITFLLC